MNDILSRTLQSFRHGPRVLGLLWDTHPALFLWVLVLNVLGGALPALLVLATQRLFNAIQGGNILVPFMLFLGVTLAQEIIRILSGTFQTLFQNHLVNRLSIRLMEKANHLPFASFEDSEVYDQLQRARQESTFRPFQIFQQFLDLISRSVTLVSVSGVLIAWKWWFALIILLLPLSSALSFLKQGEQEFWIDYHRTQKRRKHFYLFYLLTTDSSVKEIKLFDLGNLILGKYQELCSLFYDQDKTLLLRRTRLSLFFRGMTLLAVAGMQFCAVLEAAAGLLSIGSLFAYFQAIGVTRTASSDLMQTIFSLCQNNLYLSQLFSFLDLPEAQPAIATCEAIDSSGGLEVQNLSFRYPGTDRWVLKNLSFTLAAGETLAVVGENGSGKTTLVKLLTRLYDPTEGTIRFGGKAIEQYEEGEWHSKLGTVFQDFVRYELTVRENIGYGEVSSLEDEARILQAARRSGADAIIESLPQGMDTQLGKWFADGSQLSGGQWQKIAIARAYMRDAELFLLDEPTAALDPRAEADFFARFRELLEGKMGIFISHRFSTVRQASRILVLKGGEIAEMGTHEELMERDGLYASLYRMQAAAFLHA